MKHSIAPVPGDFLQRRASGSVVEAWVALDRFLPRKSTSALRFWRVGWHGVDLRFGWCGVIFGDPQAHEPAEKQVILHLFHQLALGPDRERNLDQARPPLGTLLRNALPVTDQPFRRDRRAAKIGVERLEPGIQAGQRARHRARTDGASMARFTTCLILRSGCRAAIRSSRSTKLNSDPLASSVPRIITPAIAVQSESCSAEQVESRLFQHPVKRGPAILWQARTGYTLACTHCAID